MSDQWNRSKQSCVISQPGCTYTYFSPACPRIARDVILHILHDEVAAAHDSAPVNQYLGIVGVDQRDSVRGPYFQAMLTNTLGYLVSRVQQGRARRITVGADKAYDTKDFVRTVREFNVTPHITSNHRNRSSNLDRRTTRQPGYVISLSHRWLIEKGFGWLKQTGPLRQVKLRGLEKVDWLFVFSCAAHNLLRLPRLMAQPTPAGLRL